MTHEMGKWIKKMFFLHKHESGYASDVNVHLSVEDMAAFIDGCMDADEREQVVFHLNRCATCTELFELSVGLPFSMTNEKKHGNHFEEVVAMPESKGEKNAGGTCSHCMPLRHPSF